MSKEITDWIKHERYPTLFEGINTALQEAVAKYEKKNGPIKAVNK
jgi:hypothetical protein